MSFMDGPVGEYLDDLAAAGHHHQVLVEMEGRAAEHDFPIVGRASGRFLEATARMVGARRVVELGSGYGYSAWFFSRAVGPDGEVVCTDGDADNARLAEGYLRRADLWEPVTFHIGDALTSLAATDGLFDVVYCDVDKEGYPDCWEAARARLRVGGVFLCDNTLWSGRVVDASVDDEATTAIRAMNRAAATDPDFVTSIVPIRDGILCALKVS